MTQATLETPSIRLADCTAGEIRAAFEALAKLATPDMVDWATSIARTHVRHYQTVFQFVHQICSQKRVKRVVDVGAVPGYITVTLKQNGLEAEGVDLAPDRTSRIFDSAGVPWHQVDVEQSPLPFEAHSFDLVLFNEVIEHLRINPILPIREIHRILRPGGTLLLSTPNITLPMRLRFLRGRDYQDDIITEFRKLETVGHMGHFRLYSGSEIHRLLKHVGFDAIDSHAHTVDLARPSWKRRMLTALIPEQMGDHLYVVANKPG